MEDDHIRITLRIPRELHARLNDEAEKRSTSMNAEIINRVRASFETLNSSPGTDAALLAVLTKTSYDLARVEVENSTLEGQIADLVDSLRDAVEMLAKQVPEAELRHSDFDDWQRMTWLPVRNQEERYRKEQERRLSLQAILQRLGAAKQEILPRRKPSRPPQVSGIPQEIWDGLNEAIENLKRSGAVPGIPADPDYQPNQDADLPSWFKDWNLSNAEQPAQLAAPSSDNVGSWVTAQPGHTSKSAQTQRQPKLKIAGKVKPAAEYNASKKKPEGE